MRRRYEIEIDDETYHDWNVRITYLFQGKAKHPRKPRVVVDGLGPNRTAEILACVGDLLDDLPPEKKR